ncbi:hypothetical protein OG239_43205 (plasmid) [Streptomyces sp. NBC_00868]|nr:hypothetical protein OG239_43205 [Streptomyces sp. NBC_00868]
MPPEFVPQLPDRSAAGELLAQAVPMGTVATALGTSEAAARRYVNSFLHP